MSDLDKGKKKQDEREGGTQTFTRHSNDDKDGVERNSFRGL